MLLGIDYGDKRIGLALAEERGPALPWKILTNSSLQQVLADLQAIVLAQNVTTLVVGWPVNMSGQMTERTKITEVFVQAVRDAINCPVILEDERWSSKIIVRAGISGVIDDKSAAYILQTYIDRSHVVD
ncbi:MAG: Holliday junction resolvase RuvX [Candidatus Komeilibacteria bacterium]